MTTTWKVLPFGLLHATTSVGQQRLASISTLSCRASLSASTRPNCIDLNVRLRFLNVWPRPIHFGSYRSYPGIASSQMPKYAISRLRHLSTAAEKSRISKMSGTGSNDSLVSKWLTSYEHFIGVGDVKEAQERVSMAEKEFLNTRQQVKDSRLELEDIQSELHSIRTRLDRTPRDDPKFLEYATEEHKKIQTERQVKENHHRLLEQERETFDRLSASVRESHVKQKAQEEKTKYWSIIGSVVGTVLGIIGSTFISQRRTRDLKGMVNDLKEQISVLDGGAGEELKTILQDLKKTSAESLLGGAKKENLDVVSQKIIDQTGTQLKSQEEVINQLLEKHEKSFHDEMKGVHRAIARGGSGDMSTFEELIENAEQKLEWEVKMGTLATVVLVYGAFAITVPVLYNIFK